MLRIDDWLSIECMEQLAWRCIAPTNHLTFLIGEKALHATLSDAPDCALAVFRACSIGPMNLRMIFVEALAIAKRPLRVIAEGFAFEEAHEVRQTRRR